jgi:hypothetical protein
MSKERMIFGKNKSNYIFPAFVTIKPLQSLGKGI